MYYRRVTLTGYYRQCQTGGNMKVLQGIVLLGAVVALAGCCGVPLGVPNTATPVVVDNGTQARVLVPCSNDNLCVRNTYEIAKD